MVETDEALRRDLLSDQLSKRARLPLVDEHALEVAFRTWFGLPPGPARVLISLYLARDVTLTAPALAATHATSKATIHGQVMVLRRALETEAIDYVRPDGYRLTEDGRAECLAALWQMGEALRMAS